MRRNVDAAAEPGEPPTDGRGQQLGGAGLPLRWREVGLAERGRHGRLQRRALRPVTVHLTRWGSRSRRDAFGACPRALAVVTSAQPAGFRPVHPASRTLREPQVPNPDDVFGEAAEDLWLGTMCNDVYVG